MGSDNKEEKIRTVVQNLNQKGNGIPTQISEIDNFPFRTFPEMKDAIRRGKAILNRLSVHMEMNLFSILASPAEKLMNNFALLIMYGGIIQAVIVSFLYSWWFMLSAIPLFIIGGKFGKKSYNSAILNSSFESEIIFCFLYYSSQVFIDIPAINKHYFYNDK